MFGTINVMKGTPAHRFLNSLRVIVAALWALGAAGSASAQDESTTSDQQPTGEIEVSLGSFGVGGVARAGEWVGVQVVTTDPSPTVRQIVISAAIRDIDGDTAVFERSVASNPGVRQGAWLYFRLPMSYSAQDGLEVTVSEAEEDGQRLRAGRLLARQVLRPRDVLRSYEGMIGVIGGQPLGLNQYDVPLDGATHSYRPGGHEAIRVSPSIAPEAICDRWMGLMQFDVLAWTGDQPSKLDADRAGAIKEWVRRGGHLVVVLPPVGQTWIGDDTYNTLADILPRVTVRRLEGVKLEQYRALLADDGATPRPLPENAVVHEFLAAAGAAPGEAIPVLGNPPGIGNSAASLVVRRLVGTGAVTLVGIDLANRGLLLHGRPDADLFWHRVLGHRGKLYSAMELAADRTQTPATINREQVIYDRMIGTMIDLGSSASKGVLLGFVVFVTYWLVAAPLSYTALRRYGLTRHAWVAYSAAAALFTGIAWGGVTLIKPTRVSGSHVTLMDYVYGQQTARTRTWATLLIPSYGQATVQIGEPDEPAPAIPSAVAPWEATSDMDSAATFPDARPYTVEARSPSSMTFPTRATVKQLQFDWAGGPRWLMPRPVLPQVYPETGEPVAAKDLLTGSIELLRRTGPEQQPSLRGSLAHGLPQPLRRVRVYIVRGQKPMTFSSATAPLWNVEVWQYPDPWPSDRVLDLEALTSAPGSDVKGIESYQSGWKVSTSGLGSDSISQSQWGTALEAIGFVSQFQPPDATGSAQQAAERQASHGWDLGRWFTQPCIIVVGQVGDPTDARDWGPCPTPIAVNGAVPPLKGVTMVRWIYPLPPDPPAYQQR
jgi:hypothetical protein